MPQKSSSSPKGVFFIARMKLKLEGQRKEMLKRHIEEHPMTKICSKNLKYKSYNNNFVICIYRFIIH